MATALTLPATDSLINPLQQPANEIWKKQSLEKEADGASFCTPENSPVQDKIFPSSPETSPPSLFIPAEPSTSASPTTTPTPTPIAIQNPQPATLEQILSRSFVHSDSSWTVESELEKEILRAQENKKEELLQQRKQKDEEAIALAKHIKDTESTLAQLQGEMKRKVKHIESRKDELEQFRLDFLEAVKQQVPSSSSVQKSALARMQEEHERKKLLAEWKSSESDDQIQNIRKTILLQQDEATQLNLRIVNLQKELQGLRQLEAKVFSSYRIMSDERHKRDERPPQERFKAESVTVTVSVAPKVKAQPAAPVLRSHQLRMAEQQARKAEARAARLAASYAASPSSYSPVSPSSFASSSSSSSSSKARQLP